MSKSIVEVGDWLPSSSLLGPSLDHAPARCTVLPCKWRQHKVIHLPQRLSQLANHHQLRAIINTITQNTCLGLQCQLCGEAPETSCSLPVCHVDVEGRRREEGSRSLQAHIVARVHAEVLQLCWIDGHAVGRVRDASGLQSRRIPASTTQGSQMTPFKFSADSTISLSSPQRSSATQGSTCRTPLRC